MFLFYKQADIQETRKELDRSKRHADVHKHKLALNSANLISYSQSPASVKRSLYHSVAYLFNFPSNLGLPPLFLSSTQGSMVQKWRPKLTMGIDNGPGRVALEPNFDCKEMQNKYGP